MYFRITKLQRTCLVFSISTVIIVTSLIVLWGFPSQLFTNTNELITTTTTTLPEITTVIPVQAVKNKSHDQPTPSLHKKSHENNSLLYLVVESHPPDWMGLTNQIILFSEILYLAIATRRDAIVMLPAISPSSSSSSSSKNQSLFNALESNILDFGTTTENLAVMTSGRRLRILTSEEFFRHHQNVKIIHNNNKLKLPSRNAVMSAESSAARVSARRQFENSINKVKHLPVIRLGRKSSSSNLWRVPFVANDAMNKNSNCSAAAAAVFNAVAFSEAVQKRAHNFLKEEQENGDENGRHVLKIAFHLRLEPDIVGFSSEFSPPPAEKLKTFLVSCLLPKLKTQIDGLKRKKQAIGDGDGVEGSESIKMFLLGGSSLDPNLIKVVEEECTKYFSKSSKKVSLAMMSSKQKDVSRKTTTNHFDAAVDAVIAMSASIVIGADYSTFTRAIQIRKCLIDDAERKFEALLMYDHKLSRVEVLVNKGSDLCRKGVIENVFATTPHSYVPGYKKKEEDKC